MLQDGSARLDLPAGGQEEVGGVVIKMLANSTIQNQQLLQPHLQQQQQTAAAAGDRGVQQQTAGAADNRGLQQQMAAGDGSHVQESDGAREGRVVDSSGPFVRETSARLENLSGEGRQAGLAGSYPGFRVAGQAPVENLPRRDGQRGEIGTIRGFDPERDFVAMFGFGKGDFKPTIPVSSRPSGLVGNLHTCYCGSREFDYYLCRICVLSFVTESVGTRVSKIQPLVDEL